jgi:hypothetical protein
MVVERIRPQVETQFPFAPREGEDVGEWIAKVLYPFLNSELRDIKTLLGSLTILNMSAYHETGITTPGGANTEFTVTHNLGRIPQMALWNVDAAAIIYDSRRGDWSSTEVFLKCDQATIGLTVLVL